MVGSTVARGYGAEHKARRRAYARSMAQGASYQCACQGCERHGGQCQVVLVASDSFDLGHTEDRTGWTGPECVRCNRSKGALNSNGTRRTLTVRDW